jgi:hypothetical protein
MKKTWRPWHHFAIIHRSSMIELAHSRLAFCGGIFFKYRASCSESAVVVIRRTEVGWERAALVFPPGDQPSGERFPFLESVVRIGANALVQHCSLCVDVFGRGQGEGAAGNYVSIRLRDLVWFCSL